MSKAAETGSFINGKAQAVEIMQALSPKEREKIIKHIKVKDPSLANELSQKSFSYNSIVHLSRHDLLRVCNYVDARIFGISLKGVSIDNQRTLLSQLDREYAEVSYGYLVSPQASDEKNIKRAQDKVLNVLVRLYKNSQIQL